MALGAQLTASLITYILMLGIQPKMSLGGCTEFNDFRNETDRSGSNRNETVISHGRRHLDCSRPSYQEDLGNATRQILSTFNAETLMIIHDEFHSWLSLALHADDQTCLLMDICIEKNDVKRVLSRDELLLKNDAILIAVGRDQTSSIYQQIVGNFRRLGATKLVILMNADLGEMKDAVAFGDHTLLIIPSHHNTHVHAIKADGHALHVGIWSLSSDTEQFHEVGQWKHVSGLHLETDIWKFTAFQQKCFNITMEELPIFHYRDENSEWTGVLIDMLKAIATEFNFTYNIVEPPDGKWGAVDADRKWNGMVGMVKRGEVDFGWAKFTISCVREEAIDFTVPFWYEDSVFVLKKSKPDLWFTLMGPFDIPLWCMLGATLLICGGLYGLITFLDCRILARNDSSPKMTFRAHVERATMFVFGACVLQGSVWTPRAWGLRLVYIFWWVFSIIIATVYTSNLIAALAVPKYSPSFRKLEEITRQNKYQTGVLEDTALQNLFQLAESGVYGDLWQNIAQNEQNLVPSDAEGIKKVKNEKYIYFSEMSSMVPYVYTDCQLEFGEEVFYPSAFAAVFPTHSPYLPLFNEIIQQFFESGMVDYWVRKYFPVNTCTDDGVTLNAATLDDVKGLFIILWLGVAAAAIVGVIEYAMGKGDANQTKVIRIELNK